MTGSSSVISICNRSLLAAGARSQISSLTEDSTEANALNVLFQPTFEALARTAPWACLRAQADLTLIAAAEGTTANPDGDTLPLPPSPYLYQYAYPSNCLQARFILPPFISTTPDGDVPISPAINYVGPNIGLNRLIPFQVASAFDSTMAPIETIITNQVQAQLVYTINMANPVIWDSLFESAMVSSLAAYLVPALALNLALMDRAIKQADGMISIARTRDGNETPVSMDHLPDWVRARSGGATAYNVLGNNWNNSYPSMIWP